MARRVVDWPGLKAEYASLNVSLTKFAADKGIALSAVKAHASAERWEDARSTFQSDVAAKTTEEKVKFRARTEADIDNRVHSIADTSTALIQKRLKRALEDEGNAKTPAQKKASALEVKLYMDALKESYELQRMTAGLPRQKVPDKVQVEATLEVATGVMELPKMKAIPTELSKLKEQ